MPGRSVIDSFQPYKSFLYTIRASVPVFANRVQCVIEILVQLEWHNGP